MAGYTIPLRNARLQKIVDLAGATAVLLIYGTVRPSTGGAAGGAALVSIPLKSPIGAIAAAVLTFDKPDDVQATGTGTATWARITDGTNPLIDLSVTDTTGNGEVKLNTTTITTGLFISAQSIQVTEGNP